MEFYFNVCLLKTHVAMYDVWVQRLQAHAHIPYPPWYDSNVVFMLLFS